MMPRGSRGLTASSMVGSALALLVLTAGCSSSTAPGASCEGVDCSDHGACEAGLCRCVAGWAGTRCQTCTDCGPGFSFVVFGDLNGGACDRNERFSNLVDRMAQESGIAFFVSTGDFIDGWVESSGGTLCFGRDPAQTCGTQPLGNTATLLAPIKNRTPLSGLAASFYPTIGNHDDNWGSGWYPDPCGGGICDLLSPLSPDAYLNHAHGDICSLTADSSAQSRDFYYSFIYQNSYFIVLRQNDDNEGMLACNGHSDCPQYCADPAHFGDSNRTSDCYNIAQFDWLRTELASASVTYPHIFVFTHAPLLTSSDNHSANAAAPQLRSLLEQFNVDILFNGHNHAYERTHAVRGNSVDASGTMYLTVGSAGALFDGVNSDWFTASSYQAWTTYGDEEGSTTYTKITVDGASVTGQVFSLANSATPVDTFSVTPR